MASPKPNHNLSVTLKTPIEMLDSLRENCSYSIISSRPVGGSHEHNLSVNVDGCTFTGLAKTKYIAKQRAALAAISALFPEKIQFVTVDLDSLLPPPVWIKTPNGWNKIRNGDKPNILAARRSLKTPMDMLDGLRKDYAYQYVSSSGDGPNLEHIVSLNVGDQIFIGYAKTKQLAKQRAASSAISALYPQKMQFIDPTYVKDALKSGNSEERKPNYNSITPLNKSVKTPMEMLDSLTNSCVYEVVSSRPIGGTQEHVFSVKVGSKTFSGVAKTKLLAKERAARAAITALFPEKMKFVTADQESVPDTPTTLSSNANKTDEIPSTSSNDSLNTPMKMLDSVSNKEVKRIDEQKPPNHKFNSKSMTPMDLLNQLRTGLTYNLFSPPSNGPLYTNIAYVYIDGRSFRGESKSTAKRDIRKEKLAKHRAARAAIKVLYPDKMLLLVDDLEHIVSLNVGDKIFNGYANTKQLAEQRVASSAISALYPQEMQLIDPTHVKDALKSGSSEERKPNYNSITPLNKSVKTPMEMLDSLTNSCVYEVVSSRPIGGTQEHVFSVKVGNKTFSGVAKTKLLAKERAARAAITALFPEKMKFVTADQESVPDTPKTLSSSANKADEIASTSSNGTSNTPMKMLDSVSNKEVKRIDEQKPPNHKSNSKSMTPMDLLNQLRTGLLYNLISPSSNEPPYTYIASVEIDGRCYTGESKSTAKRDILKEKLAKHRAARAAIKVLYPDKMSLLIDDPEWIPQTPMPLSQGAIPVRKALKTPMEMLNSLRNDCVYQFVSSSPHGPTHEHTFSVSFNGRTFNGVSKTKQSAKHRAARAAISAVYPDKMKFVTTDPENLPYSPKSPISETIKSPNLSLKSPVEMLDTLKSGCVYKIVASSLNGTNPRYIISVNVGDQIFRGEAKSTILAKDRAARVAISALFPEKMKFVTADPESVRNTTTTLSSNAYKTHEIASTSSNDSLKSPMEMLDSLTQSCVYQLISSSQDGPTHRYVISVNVGSRVFHGESQSTILAKHRAARAAISALFPEKIKFVSADPENVPDTPKTILSIANKTDEITSTSSNDPLRSPMNVLDSLTQGCVYKLVSSNRDGPTHRYVISVNVGSRVFHGEGQSTTSAKHRAARVAISALFPDKMCLVMIDPQSIPQTPIPSYSANTAQQDNISVTKTLKTPMEMLDSLISDCVYRMVSSQPKGATHEHTFSVSVNGRTFSGVAKTKLSAKNSAARAAILALYPDKMKLIVDEPVSEFETKDSYKSKDLSEKSFQDILPEIKCEYVENSNKNYKNLLPAFTCKFQLNGSFYDGSGTSKQNAKAAAISNYLLKKHHIMTQTETNAYCSDSLVLNPIFADKISKIVNDKYLEVAKDFPEHSKKAVHSAIVMTKSNDFSDAEVLNITTGTKCINGGYLSYQGATLNDCHAEVVSRRGLISYFYDQLMLHAKPQTANYSIFILKKNKQGFELKPGIKFHLYVSTSCCGDARVFSPYDEENSDKNLNRQSRGQLRVKIESGGTIPLKSSNVTQTWDGIMMGQPLLTMSCSDKVAKWNVVGVQGSLLTLFLDPIYLHSITVGSLFHPLHTKRALYGRIEQHLPNLPTPFKHNKILMNTIASQEPRVAAEPPIYSSNWLIHDPQPEIINSNTGKSGEKKKSRLCKMSLFLKFKQLLTLNLPPRTQFDKQLNVYLDLKKSSTDYNVTKEIFYKACADADLGKWVKKPMEQDDFEIDF